MKFWFGKKEPDVSGGVACAVLTMPEGAGVGGESVSVPAQLFEVTQRGKERDAAQVFVAQSGAFASLDQGIPVSVGVAELPAVTVPVQAPVASVAELPAVTVPVQAPVAAAPVAAAPAAAVPAAPAESRKVVLKPVAGQVRLAAVQAGGPGAGAVKPVMMAAPVAAAAPVAETAEGRPVFGLRPKAESGGGALTAAEKGVVTRDADGAAAVRPKVDQRALYYQLMNGLYDAVLVLDDQGHVVDCNTRVTEMLGYSREEAWDLPIGKVITGMASQMFEHLKRNLAENHHILIDARCFRKDGSSFAGEVGVSTLSLTRGNNMVFAIRNVERRKSAMDDLRKSHAALDNALAPAFVCDADGFFVVVNQALLEAFGIPDTEQAKEVRFMDILPDAARSFLRASCGEKLRETLNVRTPDGVPVKIQLALTPLQTGQNVSGVAGSVLQM